MGGSWALPATPYTHHARVFSEQTFLRHMCVFKTYTLSIRSERLQSRHRSPLVSPPTPYLQPCNDGRTLPRAHGRTAVAAFKGAPD